MSERSADKPGKRVESEWTKNVLPFPSYFCFDRRKRDLEAQKNSKIAFPYKKKKKCFGDGRIPTSHCCMPPHSKKEKRRPLPLLPSRRPFQQRRRRKRERERERDRNQFSSISLLFLFCFVGSSTPHLPNLRAYINISPGNFAARKEGQVSQSIPLLTCFLLSTQGYFFSILSPSQKVPTSSPYFQAVCAVSSVRLTAIWTALPLLLSPPPQPPPTQSAAPLFLPFHPSPFASNIVILPSLSPPPLLHGGVYHYEEKRAGATKSSHEAAAKVAESGYITA